VKTTSEGAGAASESKGSLQASEETGGVTRITGRQEEKDTRRGESRGALDVRAYTGEQQVSRKTKSEIWERVKPTRKKRGRHKNS